MSNKKITLSIDSDVYNLMKEMAHDFNLKNPHKTSSNTSQYIYKDIIEEGIRNLYSVYKNKNKNISNNSLDSLNKESSILKTLDTMKIKIAVPRGKKLSDIVRIKNTTSSPIEIKCIKCDHWKAIDEIIKDCPKNKELNWRYFRNSCKNHIKQR